MTDKANSIQMNGRIPHAPAPSILPHTKTLARTRRKINPKRITPSSHARRLSGRRHKATHVCRLSHWPGSGAFRPLGRHDEAD
jgi:hypothetical protein